MNKSLLFKIVVLLFVFVGSIGAVNAQVTTSTLTGTVKDAKGVMPGAGIKATHTPTGTVYTLTTNGEGRFSITNMRVGGPYIIEVNFVGFQSQKFDNVMLKLGEPYVLNVTLVDDSQNLSEVNIVGSQPNSVLNSNKSGATTTVNRQQILAMPTISRSINDITRITPQGGGPRGSIGGGNYRSNNFTVDGANFNNQFGIGENIPAGGSPISLDALEQISVNVTPFDVRQSGFTGAAINAVTRSGTNDFFGSAFYVMRSDDEQGGHVGEAIVAKNRLQEQQYGFSFGGPIIKNKLFFFINGEFRKTEAPGQNRVAATPGNPFVVGNNNVTRPTAAFLDQVSSYLKSEYNYDPGVYQGYSFKSNNDKLFGRLDWNISKNHHFNVRYSQVESKTPSFVSSSTSNSLVSYGADANRTSINALHFSNSNYYQEANLYSGTAELNSSFGRFSNSIRASYAHQNDPRSSDSDLFPLVDIRDPQDGRVATTFGYESFTYGNLRDVSTQTFNDDLTASFGKHNLTFGLQAEFSKTKNGFQRFGTGFYTFASWEDFVNKARPVAYSLTYPLTADGSQAYPSFKFAQYSAYLQDEFNITDRLKITGGLRIEQPTYPSTAEVKSHPLVTPLEFANGEKINTGVLPKSRIMVSPRFGFNWDVQGDRSLQVRGGTGIFTGRIPFVWIVSQSGDAGLLQFLQNFSGADIPLFNPNPFANVPATKPAAGTAIPSSISAMSPNLKFPQAWKSSLAVDVKLPGGIVGTVEGIYNKDINAVYARNANLNNPANLNVEGYPDNRPIFANSNADKYLNNLTSAGLVTPTATGAFSAIVMDNVKGGYYWSGTAQLTKDFYNGLFLTAAYTHSEAKNFGDGSGDQIVNLWSLPYTSTNSNTPSLGFTSNVIPDRFIASLSYRKTWLGNLATTASLFYEGQTQGRYSYYYSSDFNRDGQVNDLIYVPKDPSEITFVPLTIAASGNTPAKTYSAQEQSDLFFAYVEQDDYLKTRKGQYAERNGATSKWRNQVDFKLVQEVFRNVGGKKNSFQFTWDVFNIGNLINKDWGHVNFVNNQAILVPQNVSALVAGGAVKPTYRMATNSGDVVRNTFGVTQTIASTYYMQFGVRYSFN
jgi:hypothetical protein